jgi:hypothetical protein
MVTFLNNWAVRKVSSEAGRSSPRLAACTLIRFPGDREKARLEKAAAVSGASPAFCVNWI